MNQLRLDDVLAREVNVQWFEGVAVLQLICRALRAAGMDDATFPTAADVVVAPGGSIAITGASPGNAVSAASHLLARMLSDDVPVRLRLAVSQATATETAYATLAEFSEELAYFERPNPEAIVASLRRRAKLAAPRAEVPAAPAPRVETPAREEQRPVVAAAVAPRRVSRLAVIAAVVSAVACASVWAIGRLQVSGPALASTVAEHPQPAVSDQPKSAQAARRVARVSAASPVTVAGPTPIRALRTSGLVTAEREAPSAVEVPEQLVSYSYRQPIGPVDATPPRMLTEFSTPDPSSGADRFEEDLDRIYTRNDPDVTLPQNVYPKFATQSAASNAGSQALLELTIAKDGLVEQVKMLTPPRNIHEFMLLSAAKAWRFEPARVHGRAIRFRHLISMDATALGWNGTK